MIKAILFDLDHTLFDRHGTLKALVPALRRAFQVDPALSDAEIARIWCYADDNYVYDGWNYIFSYLVEQGVFTEPPEYREYRSFIYAAFAKVAVPFDFVLPMLERFKRSGLLLGLVTNGQHALQYQKLRLTGLLYVFDEIVVSGDVGVEKPDPEIFAIALEKLGVSPNEAIYVGDNRRNDIDGAAGAGLATVWLKSTNPHQGGRYEPDVTLPNVKTLEKAITAIADSGEATRRSGAPRSDADASQ